MGAASGSIQAVFFNSAFYLIGLGMLLGNIFGIGIGIFQSQTHFLKLDQNAYYMKFVPIQFSWSDLILVNIGTLTVCLLAMIVPSMLVAKITPVKAIRFK
jgi:lipoprotein-releasing system permease protein